jgi:protein dithiol oxidoreductase (disulfide-forming)
MRFLSLFTILSLTCLLSAFSFAESFVEGKDFVQLTTPVATQDPSRIEVVEVFSYHCPHCLDLESLLEPWVKKLPADVNFVQIHAAWQPFMQPLQRGFYTASKLNLQPKIHIAAFKEFQQKRNKLETAEAWAKLLGAHGAKREDVLKLYGTFGITTEINQANAKIRSYKITGTPTIVIDGRYRIDSAAGKDPHKRMLAIADFLINKVRAERELKIKRLNKKFEK